MTIKNLKHIDSFKEILWWFEFQIGSALFEELFIIRTDISGTVRLDAFIQVT